MQIKTPLFLQGISYVGSEADPIFAVGVEDLVALGWGHPNPALERALARPCLEPEEPPSQHPLCQHLPSQAPYTTPPPTISFSAPARHAGSGYAWQPTPQSLPFSSGPLPHPLGGGLPYTPGELSQGPPGAPLKERGVAGSVGVVSGPPPRQSLRALFAPQNPPPNPPPNPPRNPPLYPPGAQPQADPSPAPRYLLPSFPVAPGADHSQEPPWVGEAHGHSSGMVFGGPPVPPMLPSVDSFPGTGRTAAGPPAAQGEYANTPPGLATAAVDVFGASASFGGFATPDAPNPVPAAAGGSAASRPPSPPAFGLGTWGQHPFGSVGSLPLASAPQPPLAWPQAQIGLESAASASAETGFPCLAAAPVTPASSSPFQGGIGGHPNPSWAEAAPTPAPPTQTPVTSMFFPQGPDPGAGVGSAVAGEGSAQASLGLPSAGAASGFPALPPSSVFGIAGSAAILSPAQESQQPPPPTAAAVGFPAAAALFQLPPLLSTPLPADGVCADPGGVCGNPPMIPHLAMSSAGVPRTVSEGGALGFQAYPSPDPSSETPSDPSPDPIPEPPSDVPQWLAPGVATLALTSAAGPRRTLTQRLVGRKVGFLLMEEFEQDGLGVVDRLQPGLHVGK